MDKPSRHIMLDNLIVGITVEEIRYILRKAPQAMVIKAHHPKVQCVECNAPQPVQHRQGDKCFRCGAEAVREIEFLQTI